jgi:hypothetical protein
MDIKFKAMLLLLASFSINSNSTERHFRTDFQISNKNIDLICSGSSCDIEREIFKYLGYQNNFESELVSFNLYSGGVVIDSMNLGAFISNNSDFKKTEITKKIIKSELQVGTLDASLTCGNDNDYSCDEWKRYVQTARLMNYLNQVQLTFVVTQQNIDESERLRNFVANLILAAPSSKLAIAIAALGRHAVYMLTIESAVVATMSDQLSQAIAAQSLEVGDLVTYSGTGVSIIKGSGNGSGNGGSNGGGGGGEGGSGSGTAGGGFGGGVIIGGGGGGGGIGVCTGTSGNMKCYVVY